MRVRTRPPRSVSKSSLVPESTNRGRLKGLAELHAARKAKPKHANVGTLLNPPGLMPPQQFAG